MIFQDPSLADMSIQYPITLDEMQKIEPAITAEVLKVLSVEASVAARMSYGGTAPDRIRAAEDTLRHHGAVEVRHER